MPRDKPEPAAQSVCKPMWFVDRAHDQDQNPILGAESAGKLDVASLAEGQTQPPQLIGSLPGGPAWFASKDGDHFDTVSAVAIGDGFATG
jgi:hypothetical protein